MGYSKNIPRYYVFQALVACTLWVPIWVVFLQNQGVTLSRLGVLDAVGWVLMAVAEVPTGAIADRYGRKVSLALGALLYGISMMAMVANVFSPIFVVGYLLWTTSNSLFSGADMAFLYDSLAAEGREAEFEKVSARSSTIQQTANAVGSIGGAWIASFAMPLCFVVTGAFSLAAAAVVLTFREPPTRKETEEAAPAASYWGTIQEAIRIAIQKPILRILLPFSAAVSIFPFLLTYILFQPYATSLDLPVASLGIIVVLSKGAGILGSMLADRFASRMAPRVVFWAWPGALVVIQLLLSGLPWKPLIGLFVLVPLINSLARPSVSAMLNQEIPSSQRATVLSLQSLLWTAGLAVAEPLVLFVAAGAGVPRSIGVAGLLLAALTGPLAGMLQRTATAKPG